MKQDFNLTKGFFLDTVGRKWEVFFFDKARQEFRAVMRHPGIIGSKKDYVTFAVNGCGSRSKYKLTKRV